MNCAPNWSDGITRRHAIELLGGVLALMAMIPENPVVGGTVLRRAAIQSPNFATGVSGWAVNQDGSAEFNNVTIRNGQIVSGTALFYTGTPGPNTLRSSIASGNGTDRFGNAYLDGVANYIIDIPSGHWGAVSISQGAVSWWQGSTGDQTTVVYTQQASISGLGVIDLILGAGAGGTVRTQGPFTVPSGGATVTGGITADFETISASRGNLGGLLNITQLLAAPANAPILFQGQAATDKLIRMGVVGDTNGRFILSPNGALQWGPGNVGPDTTLFRASANLQASDYIAFAASTTAAEGWNAVTFANSWANALVGPALRYRRVAAPDNCVQIQGNIVAPAGIAAAQNITAALPAAYRPATVQEINCINLTGPKICNITMTPSGNLQFQANAASGDTIAIPGGNLIALTA